MPSIINIVLRSSLTGQANNPILNSFYYECDLAAPVNADLVNILNWFDANVVGNLTPMLATAILFHEISAIHVGGVAIASITPTSLSGSRSGAVLPPYVCIGFRLVRGNRSTRNGSKRFAGAVEADWNGYSQPEGVGIQPLMDDVADILGVTAIFSGITIVPIIYSKATGVYQPVVDVVPTNLTTQNSRKE